MMSQTGKTSFNDPGHAHFLTFSCFRRNQVLTDESTCQMLAKSINRSRDRRQFDLWSFVFMPDHVHLLIRPRQEEYSIAHIFKSIKAPFAKWLITDWKARHPARIKRFEVQTPAVTTYRVWERGGGYDRNLYNLDLIRRAIEYIEYNPVRRGIVAIPEDWRWSSARARAGNENAPLRIDPVMWEPYTNGDCAQ